MIEWRMRPKELSFNVNPAFCGELLYYVITEYSKKVNDGFETIYLPFVYPILFDKRIANELKSTRSNFNVICFLQVLFAESCKLKIQNVALWKIHSFAS